MIGITKSLSVNISRNTLLRIYKSFIRPHLGYGDMIYDKPNNEPFKNKTENIPYKVCIAITGDIQGTSRERPYQELSSEFLKNRRWYRKLIFSRKIVNGATPRYLTSYLNTNNNLVYNTRAPDQFAIKFNKLFLEDK